MRERLTAAKSLHRRNGHDGPASRELHALERFPQSSSPQEEIAQLKAANRQLAAQVEAIRRGATSVLHELDTVMLARAVAHQAALLLNAEYALVELYDQDLPYFRTEHVRRQVTSTRDLNTEADQVNSLSSWGRAAPPVLHF